jgi:hypothetical protein
MKVKLLGFLLLFGCTNRQDASIKMTSFKVLDQKSFEMCFNKEVSGIYALVIQTKSGREIKRAGRFTGEGQSCLKELKMQHSAASYTTAQKNFYADSLVNENIASVTWTVSRRYYEEPYAQGEFQKK